MSIVDLNCVHDVINVYRNFQHSFRKELSDASQDAGTGTVVSSVLVLGTALPAKLPFRLSISSKRAKIVLTRNCASALASSADAVDLRYWRQLRTSSAKGRDISNPAWRSF